MHNQKIKTRNNWHITDSMSQSIYSSTLNRENIAKYYNQRSLTQHYIKRKQFKCSKNKIQIGPKRPTIT